jgi:hypothetical protein
MKEFKCKVGDIVYDSFFYPGKKFIIKEIKPNQYVNPIWVQEIGTENCNEDCYSIFGALPNARKRPTLSHEPYEVTINTVTEKAEKFEFGDKCKYFLVEVVFLNYSINDVRAVIAYKTGVTDNVLIKYLVKL